MHDYVIWPNFTTRPDVTKTGNGRMGTKQRIGNEFTDRARIQVRFCSHFSFSRSPCSFPAPRSSFQQHPNQASFVSKILRTCTLCALVLYSALRYCFGNSFMQNSAALQFENEAWEWNLLVWRKHARGLLFICQLSSSLKLWFTNKGLCRPGKVISGSPRLN